MKMQNKRIIAIIIFIYALFGICIPIVFKYAVFENGAYSLLSNEGWASFLGSYVGGVLGGLGTLIAVFFTIKQTIEIQEENKADMDRKIAEQNITRMHEYNRDKVDRDAERREDDAKRERTLRKQFAEDVAELIGRYITSISNYYYASISAKRLDRELMDIDIMLGNKRREFAKARIESEQASQNIGDVHRLVYAETIKENLNVECQELEQRYDRKQKEIKENEQSGNRLRAEEAYFIIKTKLMDVPDGNELLEQLDKIHVISTSSRNNYNIDKNRFRLKEEIGELIKRFGLFRKEYIDH